VLQLFKNNHFANALVLLPLAFIVHIPLYFNGEAGGTEMDGWLFTVLFDKNALEGFWLIFISSALVFFQATFINRLAIIHRLNNEINILPGFLWLFWSAFHTEMLGVSGISPALLCVLVGMNSFMRCFKKRNRAAYLFNAGFFFSLASLFYFPLLVLLGFGFIGLFTFLSVRFPEPQQYLAGVFVPFFLAGSYAYLTDGLDFFLHQLWANQDFLGFFSFDGLETYQLGIIVLSLLLFIIALLNLSFYQAKKEIFAQRKVGLLFFYTLFVALGVVLASEFSLSYFLLLLWPLTIFISDNLYHMRNAILGELIIWFFIGVSFFIQYEFLF
jgi:hypothetical protein